MSIATIRDGLAAAMGTVSGLRVSEYFPDEINPPMAIVDTYQLAFDSAYNRGSDEITFDVLVVVKRSSERAAQEALDTYVPIIKAALEHDPSLRGAADDVHVTAMNGYAPLNQGDITYLAASFAVRVIATA